MSSNDQMVGGGCRICHKVRGRIFVRFEERVVRVAKLQAGDIVSMDFLPTSSIPSLPIDSIP